MHLLSPGQPSRQRQYYSDNQNIREMHPFPSWFMQIVRNKSMLTQGPQVEAGRGRSHCGENYSLHGMVMKAFFYRAEPVRFLSPALCCTAGLDATCVYLLCPQQDGTYLWDGHDKVNL